MSFFIFFKIFLYHLYHGNAFVSDRIAFDAFGPKFGNSHWLSANVCPTEGWVWNFGSDFRIRSDLTEFSNPSWGSPGRLPLLSHALESSRLKLRIKSWLVWVQYSKSIGKMLIFLFFYFEMKKNFSGFPSFFLNYEVLPFKRHVLSFLFLHISFQN